MRAILRGPLGERMLAAAIAIWGIDVLLVDVLNVVPMSFYWFGFRVDTDWLLFVPIIAAMSVILLRRTLNDWRTKEELSAEFEAARAMQERMVPPAADVKGYQIESAYFPARHVGGDFFRIMPADNGAVLVVVGDVSGKGLGAAMTVAALAGALDNEFSRSPGEVLEHLNRALLLRKGEGFVTCCAALLERSGKVRIANAGHLSPYTGGVDLPVEAALPLGLVDGVTYVETQLQIAEGEGLTFLSDGVVEAANSAGELFGFERTREISEKAANEIAEAAKAWGQNDDITVVSVRLVEVTGTA